MHVYNFQNWGTVQILFGFGEGGRVSAVHVCYILCWASWSIQLIEQHRPLANIPIAPKPPADPNHGRESGLQTLGEAGRAVSNGKAEGASGEGKILEKEDYEKEVCH